MYGHNVVHKQSAFSRSLANEKKLGTYYTNIGICKQISSPFSFPEEEECCVLGASISDETTVLTVIGKSTGNMDNIKIFGIELNPGTYEGIKDTPVIDYPLYSDFLTGVRIPHNSFSFCFCESPYWITV